MKIIPSEKLILTSNLPKTEALEALQSKLAARQRFTFGFQRDAEGTLFRGEITRSSFRIERIIRYRNSFLPQISGEVLERLSGSEIQVEMKAARFVRIFMTIWLSGVSLAFVMAVVSVVMGGTPLVACIVPFGMFLFGFGLFHFAFSFESKKAQRELIQIFKATVKSSS